MQTLLLFRHSYAQPPHSTSDRERQLTELGVQRANTVFAGVLARGYVPSLALVSPYRRTQQTAALALATYRSAGHTFDLQTWQGCCADQEPKEAMAHLTALAGHDTVMVIGHEPFLGALVLQTTYKRVEFLECDLVVLRWNGTAWRFEANLSYSDFLS